MAMVLWINEFPDIEADLAGGRRTQIARLGREKAVRVYAVLMTGAYALIPVGVLCGFLPIWALAALLPTLLASKAVRAAMRYYNEPQRAEFIPAMAFTVLSTALTITLLIIAYAIAYFVPIYVRLA